MRSGEYFLLFCFIYDIFFLTINKGKKDDLSFIHIYLFIYFLLTQIHGDKSQSERDYVLRQFRSGKSNILVATDVAARGLDVDGIKHVINFDYPGNSEDYIHRIGRTGRSETTGTSYAFFTQNNAKQAADLVSVLKEAKQEIDPKLLEMASRNRGGRGGFDRASNRRYGSFQRGSFGGRNGSSGGGRSWGGNNNNRSGQPNNYTGNFNRNDSTSNSRKTFD